MRGARRNPQCIPELHREGAGVGVGTLDRHFPSCESLVLGVYRKEIETLVALAPKLLAKHPPLLAFRKWCDRLAQSGRMKYGVADIVHVADAQPNAQHTYASMLGAVRQLMEACISVGSIDPQADPEGFLVFVGHSLMERCGYQTDSRDHSRRITGISKSVDSD